MEHLNAVSAGKSVCIIKDKRWGAYYDCIDDIIFSPDSLCVAVIVQIGSESFVVIDEQPQLPFDQIVAHSFRFSPNSPRHAYIAVKGGDQFAVVRESF